MSAGQIYTKLREKIASFGFKSAKFQFALLNEEGVWKVFAIRVVLDDIQEYGKKVVHLSQGNFVLEDYWVSLGQFYDFLEYLKKVDVSYGSNAEISGTIPKDLMFTLDNYDLCLFGNFPSGELHFHNSQIGRRNGLDKGCYYTEYSLQGSAQSRSQHELSLTHHEPPFHDVFEAVNYYWKSDYDYSTVGTNRISFFLPHLDGSIRNCELEGHTIRIKVDVDTKRASYKEITLAVIAKGQPGNYREKYTLESDTLELDLGFSPDSYTVTMNRGTIRLDEYSYYSPHPKPISSDDVLDRYVESKRQGRKHVIYVDAGFKKGKGGHIAWFNETTGVPFEQVQECPDSYRCEYVAITHALEHLKDFQTGDDVEILNDNLGVIQQLKHEYGINNEDIRQLAMTVWNLVAERYHGKVKFMYIPREANKAGKLLGS